MIKSAPGTNGFLWSIPKRKLTKTVARELRQALLQRYGTIAAAARECKYSRQHLCNILAGRRGAGVTLARWLAVHGR